MESADDLLNFESQIKNNTVKTKKIEAIVAPPRPHFVGNGFRVHGFIPAIPQLSRRRMDPFLVLDYNSKFTFPPSEEPKGVGVHPHKGFETVTLAYKGSVAHHDSSGGGGVIREGDVQWMTAGNGVLHKEYHAEEFNKKGGEFQMIQLWINLKAKDKNQPAKYQAIPANSIAKHELDNDAGTVEVVAGNYKGTQGPAKTFSPVHLYNARLHKGGKADFSFPEDYTTLIIVLEGSIRVNGTETVATDHLVLFKNEGENFSLEAVDDALVFVLSGEPLKEPIAAYGPFVMNTEEELVQAFNDFKLGKFGYLE